MFLSEIDSVLKDEEVEVICRDIEVLHSIDLPSIMGTRHENKDLFDILYINIIKKSNKEHR